MTALNFDVKTQKHFIEVPFKFIGGSSLRNVTNLISFMIIDIVKIDILF